MLCTARTKDTALHRGTLVDVTQSTFAPSTTLRRALASGSVSDEAFAERYALELRQRWSLNPLPFREVIAQATSGDVMLVDTWGDVRHAPRRVLARGAGPDRTERGDRREASSAALIAEPSSVTNR